MRTLELKRAACLGLVTITGMFVAALPGCGEEGQTAACSEIEPGSYRYTDEDEKEFADPDSGPLPPFEEPKGTAEAIQEGCITAAAPNAKTDNSTGGTSSGGGTGGTP